MSSDAEWLLPPENSQDFESFCLDLWREIWRDPNAQKNGRSGLPQTGVDFFGQNHANEGKWAGVQCKQKDNLLRTKLTVRELEAEVKQACQFKPPLSEFILATSGPADEKVQQRARELTDEHQRAGLFKVTVCSWQEIRHEIRRCQELLGRIGPVYWPAVWAPPRTSEMNAVSVEKQAEILVRQRLSAIPEGILGMPLLSPEAVVFHIIPVATLNASRKFSFEGRVPSELVPIKGTPRFSPDLDGVLGWAKYDDRCLGYTKLLDTGLLESVDCSSVYGRLNEQDDVKHTFSPELYEGASLALFPQWLEGMTAAGIEPPAFVALSLIGMKGKMPNLGPSARFRVLQPGLREIHPEQLRLGPIRIKSFGVDARQVIPPLCHGVWQACGVTRSPYFDDKGGFVPP